MTADAGEPSARDKWGMHGMQRDLNRRFFYPQNANLREKSREILDDKAFSLYGGDSSKVHFTEPDKVTALDVAPLAVGNDIRVIILGDLGLYTKYRNYPLAAFLEATKAIMPRPSGGDRKKLLKRFNAQAAVLMPQLTEIANALEGVRYKVDTLNNRPLSEEERVTFAARGVRNDAAADDADEEISDDDDIAAGEEEEEPAGSPEAEGDIDFMGH